jgi:hypothetical protein
MQNAIVKCPDRLPFRGDRGEDLIYQEDIMRSEGKKKPQKEHNILFISRTSRCMQVLGFRCKSGVSRVKQGTGDAMRNKMHHRMMMAFLKLGTLQPQIPRSNYRAQITSDKEVPALRSIHLSG